jgi:hypothetical protein
VSIYLVRKIITVFFGFGIVLTTFQNCTHSPSNPRNTNEPIITPSPSPMKPEPLVLLVDLNQTINPLLHIGFLHGLSAVNYNPDTSILPLLEKLKPQFWRIGLDSRLIQNYFLAKKLNPSVKITAVLSDILTVRNNTDYSNYKPWNNWSLFETDVKEIVTSTLLNNIKIDYWDIWSEPDTPAMWSGTCAQLLEMFQRAGSAIRAADPGAKIVGPSPASLENSGTCQNYNTTHPNESFMVTFLNFIKSNQLHFDAISWHEFDNPLALQSIANNIKSFFMQNGNLSIPEIHVNEYTSPNNYKIPGWTLGWLYYLELAPIDVSNHACWDNGKECSAGLNGLFQQNNLTPNSTYWVYEAYASLGSNRVKVETSNPNVVALVGKDDSQKSLTLLIGRFEGTTVKNADVGIGIKLLNFIFDTHGVKVEFKKIPNDNYYLGLAQGPQLASMEYVPVVNHSVDLSISHFQDGEVYIVKVTSL